MRWLFLLPLALVLAQAPARTEDAQKGRIVYTRKEGDRYLLHVMNADGSGDRVVSNQPANANFLPTWSPDGKRIAYTSAESFNGPSYQVSVINSDGTGGIALPLPQKFAAMPAWSPDGKLLAFVAGHEDAAILVADPDGNNSRQVSPPGNRCFSPFWTRNGKSVGYTRPAGPPEMKADLVLAKSDGSGLETLLPSDKLPLAGPSAVSPDDKRLIISLLDPVGKLASVQVVDLASKAASVVLDLGPQDTTTGPHSLLLPAWAPDGKSFLVTMKTDKGYALFRVSDDGKSRTRLTPENTDCFGGDWTAAQ